MSNVTCLHRRGLTLVEIVVVIGIFAAIAAIVLMRNQAFNSSILLTNVAYEVALTVREAQVFGLSVRGFGAGAAAEFNVGYGVHFDRTDLDSFLLFADRGEPANNFTFDSSPVNETVETFAFTRGIRIRRFCAFTTTLTHCSDSGAGNQINWLSVVFVRPDPNAYITSDLRNDYGRAEFTIEAPGGLQKRVVVESTGQIAVPQN